MVFILFSQLKSKDRETHSTHPERSTMNLLLITNLFPPQELGGYGRAMEDFAWGLEQRGHSITILTSDAPYLENDCNGITHTSIVIIRDLQLKGSWSEDGITYCINQSVLKTIDSKNIAVIEKTMNGQVFDGVILGNIDLLGHEILPPLLDTGIPLRHHCGFVAPPFESKHCPKDCNYQLVAASKAVLNSLLENGLPVQNAQVIYPGARCDQFGSDLLQRSLPAPLGLSLTPNDKPLGSISNPLRICFAGLIIASKGVHTLAEAIIILRERGVHTYTSFAGKPFQAGYQEAIEKLLAYNKLMDQVNFVGQLKREQLARFYLLNHVAIFPSIYPEAFGIVAAEAMASGLILVSSGAGGASELFEDGISGLSFQPGNPQSLADVLQQFVLWPSNRIKAMALAGQNRVRESFSVLNAAEKFEKLFRCCD